MIEFNKTSKYIELEYIYGDYNNSPEDWLINKIKSDGECGIYSNTFTLKESHIVDKSRINFSDLESVFEAKPNILFRIAELKEFSFENKTDEYYEFYEGVLGVKQKVLFHKNIDVDTNLFIAETRLSIFQKIAELTKDDIIIGGLLQNSIPLEEFYGLINNFPTTYEKKLFAQSRISSVLKNYFENVKDAERSYTKYRNKKTSNKGVELVKMFEEYEVDKYQTIYDKLSSMLDDEENYNEISWQKEIIDILLLLYPKYITVFSEVPISADGLKQKRLDYLFVDANGHVDIVEIKKPFEQAIMTKNKYRDNFIPLRELSGTVMQIEKYIYFLNRWAKAGEKKLTQKYKEKLPKDFEIHITNPKGFIIMGRENNLTKEQKNDFEVVKRKYKNVIDILSYDDLLNRLKFAIEQIKLR
jgi:hypothetical protein